MLNFMTRQPSRSLRPLMLCLALGGGMLSSGSIWAAPAAPVVHSLTQPDGKTFAARQWGDEWSHGWETTGGYTIVQEKASKKWYYAKRAADGSLVPSLDSADRAPSRALQPKLRPTAQAMQRSVASRSDAAQRVVPPTGTANIPVILMNFNGSTTTYTVANATTLLFGSKASDASGVISGPGSMREYFEEVSYGNFSISAGPSGISGWHTAAQAHDYYGENNDAKIGELVREAVLAADASLDFSQYDSDNDGKVDVVAIIHQGRGEEESGNGNDIWSHRWTLSSAGVGSITLDGKIIDDYIVMPETYGDAAAMATIGVATHEYGHALGLPDLYDTDDSSEGIGNWGLMGGGAWTQVTNPGDSPAHMIAWSKYALGWISPTRITRKLEDEPIPAVASNATAYICADNPRDVDWKMDQKSGTGEYYLIENRSKTGFDQGLPGEGLLISHIDESVTSSNSANTNEAGRRLVSVVQADGSGHLESKSNRGDAGDLFPGSSNNTRFAKDTTPAATRYDGNDTTLVVENITAASATLSCGADIGFTIDDTGSMGNDIAAVRNGLSAFINFLKTEEDTPTIAMHTFKDSATLRVVSDNLDTVETAVTNLFASGGGDCPEFSLSGLYDNASALHNDTPILFATDASANPSDPITIDQLAARLRGKGIRVYAFLTGDCSDGSIGAPRAFAPRDPVQPNASQNPGGQESPSAAGALALGNTLETYAQIAGSTGGALIVIPEAKFDSTANDQMAGMITGVMKGTAAPQIVSVQPRSVVQGATMTVQVDAIGTNFTGTPTLSINSTGVTVTNVQVLSSSRLLATLQVAADADMTELRQLNVSTNLGGGSTETAGSESILHVAAPSGTPQIVGASPAAGKPGQTLTVTVSGVNTHFNNSSSVAFGPGITVNSVTPLSETAVQANITIAADAAIATRDVSVTTTLADSTETALENMVGPFMVEPAALAIPEIASVTPSTGQRGQDYTLAIVGTDTNFAAGTTAYFSGEVGITVNSVTVTDATHADVAISVASDAALGYRSLTLETGSGLAAMVDAFRISAAVPVASFNVPEKIIVNQVASFTDTSTDSDGTVAAWAWDFGDSTTSTEQNPSHTFSAAGDYTVTLTVTDSDGEVSTTASQSVKVMAIPTASFTVPDKILTGQSATFTDTSTDSDGTVAAWAWDFGDSTTSTEQHPSHTFSTAGNYTVTLTVTDNDGNTSTVASQSIKAMAAPVGNFTAPTTGTVGQSVSFTDTSTDSDGTISSWAWNFGDSSTATTQNPSHTFNTAGTFTVTLTVTDNDGNVSAAATKSITISAAPSGDSSSGGGSLGRGFLLAAALLLAFRRQKH